MGKGVKFAILEIEGEELFGPTEYVPDADDVLYEANNEKTVKDAVDEAEQVPRICYKNYRVFPNRVAIVHKFDIRKDLQIDGDMVII